MKAIIAVLVLILASSSLAFARSKDASYDCVGEVSGGLKYDETLKQWEGVSFHPSDKFVLRMKFLRGDQFLGKPVSDYYVTITRSGRNDAEGCVRNDVNKTVYVNPNGVFQCGLGHWEYVFNVHTKRFLAFYLSGYVDGDKTGDTPSVEVAHVRREIKAGRIHRRPRTPVAPVCASRCSLLQNIERVGHMVSINEELEVAKAAKAAIKALSTATSKPAVLTTLKNAYRAAILNFSSGGALNAARAKVGITLSNIMHGLPTKEKIDEGTSAIDVWITELEGRL